MEVAYLSIWAEGREQTIARQALRRNALMRRVNDEALKSEWLMNSKYNPVGKDQMTSFERLNKPQKSKIYLVMFAVLLSAFAVLRLIEIILQNYAV